MTTKRFKLVLWTITLIVIVASCVLRFSPFAYDVSETSEYNYSGKSISEINVDVDVADLNIKYGKDFKVYTNYQKVIEPEVTLSDGKLDIKQENKNINQGYLKDCSIKIVVPKGTKIEGANIITSAGDIDISEVGFESIMIDAEAGDIDINDVTAKSLVIDAEAGDIDITKSDFKSVDITTEAGDIDLEDVSSSSGTFDSELGGIDINGKFDKITATCELGSIDITVPDANKVDFDLDCELGSIKVNGKNWNN